MPVTRKPKVARKSAATSPSPIVPATPLVFNPVLRPRAMTLTDWRANEGLRNRLATLLADPTMLEAIATLKDTFLPSAPAELTHGATGVPDNIERILSMRYIHRAGFFGFINALTHLTRTAQQQEAAGGWGTGVLQPEAE